MAGPGHPWPSFFLLLFFVGRQHSRSIAMSKTPALSTYLKTTHQRVNAILKIVMDALQGAPSEELAKRVSSDLGDVTAPEFTHAVQTLSTQGISDDDYYRNIDKVIEIFAASLSRGALPNLPEGHPITTDLAENQQILGLLDNLEGERRDVADTYEKLRQVNLHYARKENQLFPLLERKGLDKPTTIMWRLHNSIRQAIKGCQLLFRKGKTEKLTKMEPKMLQSLTSMVFKEEKILLPSALQLLTEEEWAEIARGAKEIGFCLIAPPPPWQPQKSKETSPMAPSTTDPSTPTPAPAPGAPTPSDDSDATDQDAINQGAISLDEGSLTPKQINLIFGHLPLDLTYVDEHDEVRFYNRDAHRIFPRSPGIIGRQVKHCHPPKSVHIVEEIVAAFKAGKKNTADFWIQMNDKFISIRYFAVRDSTGNYKGVLEVSQEVSELRALEGQQRLLDWNLTD